MCEKFRLAAAEALRLPDSEARIKDLLEEAEDYPDSLKYTLITAIRSEVDNFEASASGKTKKASQQAPLSKLNGSSPDAIPAPNTTEALPLQDDLEHIEKLSQYLEKLDYLPPTEPNEDPFDLHELVSSTSAIDELLRIKEGDQKQESLSLLYLIAEDRNKMIDGVHHGVSCNYCGVSPITGPRYHCSNCPDVDLCEACELAGKHTKLHLHVKIKVPLPLMKTPRWRARSPWPVQSVVRNFTMPDKLSEEELYSMCEEFSMFPVFVETKYDAFKNIADYKNTTPDGETIYGVTKETLCSYLLQGKAGRVYKSTLFSFFDTDKDGIVTFQEFLGGLHVPLRGPDYRIVRRTLEAWDRDGDGIISKKDVIEKLASCLDYYARLVPLPDGGLIHTSNLRRIWETRQPLSSLFPIPAEGPISSMGQAATMLGYEGTDAVIHNHNVYEALRTNENVPLEMAHKYGLLNYGLVHEIQDKQVETFVDMIFKAQGWTDKVDIKTLGSKGINKILDDQMSAAVFTEWIKSIIYVSTLY